jgi:hypothetical protein
VRTPTEKQYEKLRVLNAGNVCVTATGRYWEPLIRNGWVERLDKCCVRITPDGMRAVAAAMEKHGRPEFPGDFPVRSKGERAD